MKTKEKAQKNVAANPILVDGNETVVTFLKATVPEPSFGGTEQIHWFKSDDLARPIGVIKISGFMPHLSINAVDLGTALLSINKIIKDGGKIENIDVITIVELFKNPAKNKLLQKTIQNVFKNNPIADELCENWTTFEGVAEVVLPWLNAIGI